MRPIGKEIVINAAENSKTKQSTELKSLRLMNRLHKNIEHTITGKQNEPLAKSHIFHFVKDPP